MKWTTPKLTLHVLAVLLATSCSADTPTISAELGAERRFRDRRELDVRFESRDAVLAGTVYFPAQAGQYPAVAVNPGSSWTTRATWSDVKPFVTNMGGAVLSYDKRGHGESTGTCCPVDPNELFDLLADDMVAATETLRSLTGVLPSQVGLFGSSQGGWVVPVAANRAALTTAFNIVTVGGAVSTGQENLYDPLTGYDICEPTGTPMEEIIAQLKAVGPSGFDPRQSLEQLSQPTIWIFGENDLSHPTRLATEILDEIGTAFQKDWTVVVLPDANHDLIQNGSICQTDGPLADIFTPLTSWFDDLIQ